jgi:hypothetical protein
MKHESLSLPPASDARDPSQAADPRWTSTRMIAFLHALAATHSVKAAAKSVGMSRQSAYRLRSKLKGLAFDAAWDEVFKHSYENLPYAALERALNGIKVPHYYKGELIGTSRRYDERLTVTLLKMISSAPCLMVGSDAPGMQARGRRFDALVARIEAEGERATGFPDADSSDLSPLSDDEIKEELRRFEKGQRG